MFTIPISRNRNEFVTSIRAMGRLTGGNRVTARCISLTNGPDDSVRFGLGNSIYTVRNVASPSNEILNGVKRDREGNRGLCGGIPFTGSRRVFRDNMGCFGWFVARCFVWGLEASIFSSILIIYTM